MVISSCDGKIVVDVGSSDIWHSVYSTVVVCLKGKTNKICDAIEFMEKGKCNSKECLEVARQFNLIRDALSTIEPSKAVYDLNDRQKVAPWANKLSPIITSCANMFTTSDGRDLLSEIVGVLCYAYYAGTGVAIY